MHPCFVRTDRDRVAAAAFARRQIRHLRLLPQPDSKLDGWDLADPHVTVGEGGWPRDDRVFSRAGRGAPAAGHPRRCQGTKRRSKTQCVFWALKGSPFCRNCGASQKLTFVGGQLGRYYASRLGPTLKERIREIEAEGPDARNNISEEIDLARVAAAEAVALFEQTVLDPTAETAAKLEDKPTIKARITEHMKTSLENVADLVMKNAKLRALAGTGCDIETLDYVLTKVSQAVHAVLIEEESRPDLAKRITERIDEIRLPEEPDSNAMRPVINVV